MNERTKKLDDIVEIMEVHGEEYMFYREIPIDVIKVDQSFVKDLAEDAYSQSFIKMVAELAETIGVSVCVEGIETPEQFRVLQGMKVKYIQGYYFDRPLERHAFEAKYVK